jgi:phosphoserine phosphatase RsbU/P
VDAAVTMAEVRGVLRGIVQTSEGSPAEVLTALDGALGRLGGDTVITLVVAVLRLDDDGGLLRWANAGHPPPMHLAADGSVEILERTPDLLVGVDPSARRHDHEMRLARGDTVLLYTDGLVERRGSPLDAGTAWLAEELAAQAGRPLPQLCDEVVSGMSDRLADDVAVLAVRLRDSTAQRAAGGRSASGTTAVSPLGVLADGTPLNL